MDAQAETAVKLCITCRQTHDITSQWSFAPRHYPVPLPDGAWEKRALHNVGPFDIDPTDRVSFCCDFTKWPEIAFMPQV